MDKGENFMWGKERAETSEWKKMGSEKNSLLLNIEREPERKWQWEMSLRCGKRWSEWKRENKVKKQYLGVKKKREDKRNKKR